MPVIVWIGLGGLGISILMFVTGNWSGGIWLFVITGLVCGAYEKLDKWGLIPEHSPQPKKKTLPPARLPQADTPPPLPPPVLPERRPGPIQGTMRVDVTQTAQTVDVFIVLSEEAKFIVENSGLLDTPIEQNFEGLKQHMADFTEGYDLQTNESIDDPWAEREAWTTAGMTQKAISKQVNKDVQEIYQAKRQAGRKYELEDEAERYKKAHTVRLRQYLNNPYRKEIGNPLEATDYIRRLEKQYLPMIKGTIDAASPEAKQQRSYDF